MAARNHAVDDSPRPGLPASSKPAFVGCVLSARELETLRRLARGLTYGQAAQEMGCSASTVRTLMHTALRRLGASTLAEALAGCTRAGWLDVVAHDGEVVELADRRVTWAQRLYLEAFDQFLRAGEDPADIERTQMMREATLTGLFKEIHRERPWRAAAPDPLERIVRTLRRLDARAERRPAVDQVPDCPGDQGRNAGSR